MNPRPWIGEPAKPKATTIPDRLAARIGSIIAEHRNDYEMRDCDYFGHYESFPDGGFSNGDLERAGAPRNGRTRLTD